MPVLKLDVGVKRKKGLTQWICNDKRAPFVSVQSEVLLNGQVKPEAQNLYLNGPQVEGSPVPFQTEEANSIENHTQQGVRESLW